MPEVTELSPDAETPQEASPAPPALGVRLLAALFLVVAVVYVASPVSQNGDSFLYFPTAYSIVHDRSLELDDFSSPEIEDHYGNRPAGDGHRAGYFPWAPALFLTPVIVGFDAGEAVGIGEGSLTVAEDDRVNMNRSQILVASLIGAAVVALIALIVFDRLDLGFARRRLVAVATALAFAFGTSLWSSATRALWQHGPSLLAAAVGLWCLQRIFVGASRPRPELAAAFAGAALAAGYAFRPGNSVAVVGLAGLVLLQRRRLAGYLAGGAALVAVPWLAVNWSTYGSLLQPYYSGERLELHGHYAEALAGNLVSPARGLFVFSPFLVLALGGLWRRLRTHLRPGLVGLDVTLVVVVVLHWLTVSAYGHWWGGHSYGPRFMTDVLVYLAALATPAASTLAAWWQGQRRPAFGGLAVTALAVVALAWSIFVHGHGAFVSAGCWDVTAEPDMPGGRAWSWHDPQFLYAFQREDEPCPA